MFKSIKINKLKKIRVNGGDVFKGVALNEDGFVGFGEAYFSWIEPHFIKGWKRHNCVTLNLIVPVGKIRFVLGKRRPESDQFQFMELILSHEDYNRLTVPPGFWMAFQGLSNQNSLLLNVIDQIHDPLESDQVNLNELPFKWG